MSEPQERKSERRIHQFVGMFSNADPLDLPDGAMPEQVNMTCLLEGELRCRDGFRDVTFDA